MWNFFDIIVFVAGGAVVWFGKDPITKAVVGVETFIANLKAKAAALEAATKATAAPVAPAAK